MRIKNLQLLRLLRSLVDPSYKKKYQAKAEKERLLSTPRYTPGTVQLRGKQFKFIDSASYFFMHEEIFKKEVYAFTTSNPHPFIIDVGANIGLSAIYFKQLYPNAKLIAFEPDRMVFKVLEENIASFLFNDVILINKAVWHEEATLEFFSEGSDGGRILSGRDESSKVLVESLRLGPYLRENKIDFLKMDIEGAEFNVLRDCKDDLVNVERIFVEYHSFLSEEQLLPELLSLLKAAGFRLSISSPGLKSNTPFTKIVTYLGMDMQLNIYGYRS